MKYLTYGQTYERIKETIEGVTEELEALQYINELNNNINDELANLEIEIGEVFEDEQVEQIMHSIYEESIEVDSELEKWLEDFVNKRGQHIGLDETEILSYLDFIKDKEKKEEAIMLLKNIVDGPEIEQYRNLRAFFDFLQQELQEDIENAPEILQIKQKALLYLISNNTINIEPTDIFYLDGNKKVDAYQHALYLGFKSAAEDISPDDFENFYREIMKYITNPYTKIGMNMIYLSKIEEYMLNNPNYKPSAELINEAIPYLSFKISLDKLGVTSEMSGTASNVFFERCNIWDDMYFANFYIQTTNMDRELYSSILKDTNGLNPTYVKLIQNLAQGKSNEITKILLNDIFYDFIKSQMQRPKEEKITEPEFIALILQSLAISSENLKDYIQKIQSAVKDKETLSKKDLINISSLMFYIEETEGIPQTMRNMLKEATTNWIDAYTDGSKVNELKSTVESICEQAMQLDEVRPKIKLTDEEIEHEMFNISQDFYKEFVASYILRNLSEKAEAQIYKYEQEFLKNGIGKERYLEALKYAYSSPETFDKNMQLFDKDKQEWIKSLISTKEDTDDTRNIDCDYIVTFIFSMKNPESIKQAIESLYRIMEGDVNHIYRESSELISLLQQETVEEELTRSRADSTGRKLMLLNIMFLLPEDLRHISDNENSYFHTILRADEEVKEHGTYFAFRSLRENMSQDQFERFYNKIYAETSSDNVRAGLDMYYVCNMEACTIHDEDFSPDINKIEGKLPVILAQNYMLREAKIQMYQYGTFSSAFKHDIPTSTDTAVTANYLNRCEIQDDFYSVIANRSNMNEVSEDTVGALRGLGVLKEHGKNSEFYKKYIKKFCGDFIEEQRESLLQPASLLSKAYMAMLLNTSLYGEVNESSVQTLKKLSESFKVEKVLSSNLFDIGSYLMFLEKSIIGKNQIEASKILSDLGEDWMECYLDGGKVPEEMRANLAMLLSTFEKQFSHEER